MLQNYKNYSQFTAICLYNYNTRDQNNLLTPRCHLQKSPDSYVSLGIALYNKLPLTLIHLNIMLKDYYYRLITIL